MYCHAKNCWCYPCAKVILHLDHPIVFVYGLHLNINFLNHLLVLTTSLRTSCWENASSCLECIVCNLSNVFIFRTPMDIHFLHTTSLKKIDSFYFLDVVIKILLLCIMQEMKSWKKPKKVLAWILLKGIH